MVKAIKKMKGLLHKAHNILLLSHLGMMIMECLESGVWGFGFWLSLIVNGLLLIDWEGIIHRLSDIEARVEHFLLENPVDDSVTS